MERQKIRIGVIGLGFGRHHVRTLANMPEAELVAVADRHPRPPRRAGGVCRRVWRSRLPRRHRDDRARRAGRGQHLHLARAPAPR